MKKILTNPWVIATVFFILTAFFYKENIHVKTKGDNSPGYVEDGYVGGDKFETKTYNWSGGVQQIMKDSPGGTQVVFEHVEKVIINTTPTPRTFSADLAEKIVSNLKKQDPATIEIRSVLGDQESLSLATQIAGLFKQAGWQVNSYLWPYSKPFKEIIFESRHALHREGIASAIALMLHHLDQEPQLYRLRSLELNHYRLTIGSQ